MSEAWASGSAGGGGSVPLSNTTRPACLANPIRRASKYRPWALVRLVSLEVATTTRSQNALFVLCWRSRAGKSSVSPM